VTVDELIIEVRDPDFERVGQFRPGDLVGAKFVLRFNNVGAWEMTLPSGNRLGELLRQPGYGILVTGPDDSVIFSGPTLSAKLEQTSQNIQGDWLISGASDAVLLAERLAYPNPTTDDVTAQGIAYDARLGAAETVLKDYVRANIGPTAPVSRQVDDALVFSVYEPQDKTAIVRMDLFNQKLSRAEYAYATAKVTRAIVGGQGEAEWRRFVEVTTTDSLSAEDEWGRRIEVFKDGRNSRITSQLTQDGLEMLVDEGKTITELSVTPSDDINMRFGQDWYLGDKVTVVIDELEAQAVVTEVGLSIDADGVRIAATVGTAVGIDYEAKVLAKQQNVDQRVSNLERTVTGYGINIAYQPEGGTSGTQPTFSGPAITGSFNRFGNMVHFSIQVDFDNITSFGTGQYYLTLPFPARVAYQFRDGCLHDASASRSYSISGHVNAGSDILQLFTTDSQGNRIFDFAFSQGEPVTLTTADSYHIAGTYEIEG